MGKIVKTFCDGTFLEYGSGAFDDWCVYLINLDGERKPPKDVEYFSELKLLSRKHGAQQIYDDYISLYLITTKTVEDVVFSEISKIASTYDEDALQVEKIFSILYMAMIAEEQKAYTRLGKRIKRLGMHVLLCEEEPPALAATFMKGMHWHEIDDLCKRRGF